MEMNYSQQSNDFARVEKAIAFIEANFRTQPGLKEIADSVHLSEFHFERLFKRWVGISPKRFLQYVTLEFTKSVLTAGSVQECAYAAGLSGSGRLHDLFVTMEAMTPGQYKKRGGGIEIAYAFHPTPFGECLLASTARGICHLAFTPQSGRSQAVEELSGRWPEADFTETPGAMDDLIRDIFFLQENPRRPFHLHLKGTNFQINVWKALLRIPEGCLTSYQDLAAYLGKQTAARAVGSAVGANPVGYIIPCHRVITKAGAAQAYRWGTARKKAMIAWEACRASQNERRDSSFRERKNT